MTGRAKRLGHRLARWAMGCWRRRAASSKTSHHPDSAYSRHRPQCDGNLAGHEIASWRRRPDREAGPLRARRRAGREKWRAVRLGDGGGHAVAAVRPGPGCVACSRRQIFESAASCGRGGTG